MSGLLPTALKARGYMSHASGGHAKARNDKKWWITANRPQGNIGHALAATLWYFRRKLWIYAMDVLKAKLSVVSLREAKILVGEWIEKGVIFMQKIRDFMRFLSKKQVK